MEDAHVAGYDIQKGFILYLIKKQIINLFFD